MPETSGLGSIPYIVLGLYLLVLLAFGIQGYRRRQNDSEEDYYLAGRNQGWVVSSLTIMQRDHPTISTTSNLRNAKKPGSGV